MKVKSKSVTTLMILMGSVYSILPVSIHVVVHSQEMVVQLVDKVLPQFWLLARLLALGLLALASKPPNPIQKFGHEGRKL